MCYWCVLLPCVTTVCYYYTWYYCVLLLSVCSLLLVLLLVVLLHTHTAPSGPHSPRIATSGVVLLWWYTGVLYYCACITVCYVTTWCYYVMLLLCITRWCILGCILHSSIRDGILQGILQVLLLQGYYTMVCALLHSMYYYCMYYTPDVLVLCINGMIPPWCITVMYILHTTTACTPVY